MPQASPPGDGRLGDCQGTADTGATSRAGCSPPECHRRLVTNASSSACPMGRLPRTGGAVGPGPNHCSLAWRSANVRWWPRGSGTRFRLCYRVSPRFASQRGRERSLWCDALYCLQQRSSVGYQAQRALLWHPLSLCGLPATFTYSKGNITEPRHGRTKGQQQIS